MVFFSKHFIIYFFITYNNFSCNICLKKSKIYCSFIRSFLRKKIKNFFLKIKYNFHGYKICFFLNFIYNLNRYYKLFSFKNFFFELIFILRKIFHFLI